MQPGQEVASMAERIPVLRTAKLFIGGAFPRSESGRTFEVVAPDGTFLANAALASRKDVRDAVVAARAAQPGWAGATPFNRGQVLHRIAELVEGRRGQFIDELRAHGAAADAAAHEADATIDRLIWYAGWTDKFAQIAGSVNPVAGPFFNVSVPEPVGVVAVIAPQTSALLGLVSVVAPALVAGNTVVVLASEQRPLPAVTLAEVLATSDVPGGVVNVLTGRVAELAPTLAGHLDVDGLDLTGLPGAVDLDTGLVSGVDATALETAAAEGVTRVLPAPSREPDFLRTPRGVERIMAWCDIKTVWHPKGT
jgi:acyl-CoA reductase-like NAD-dependent aldehyde dehydrogenase